MNPDYVIYHNPACGNSRKALAVLREHGIEPSRALFHAETDMRHLATPDGLVLRELAPGVTEDEVRAKTEPAFTAALD